MKRRVGHREKAAERGAKKRGGTRGTRARASSHDISPTDEKTLVNRVSDDKKPVRGRPFVSGDSRINRTKAGPGRPKRAFTNKCRRLLKDPRTWRAVRRIMVNENNKMLPTMFKILAAHAHGSPTQKKDVNVKVSLEQLVASSYDSTPPKRITAKARLLSAGREEA